MRREFFLLLSIFALAACSKPREAEKPPPPQFDPARFDGQRALYEAASIVAVGPRESGSPGAKKASDFLLKRLLAIGVTAEIDVFTAPTPRGDVIFRNVVGRIPGSDPRIILLASHYDTKSGIPGFVGANDSGSSSGALLELARVLSAGPRVGPTVQFLFFDGEECMEAYGPRDGFQGSRHHAWLLKRANIHTNVVGMILLDMIGDKNLTVTLPRNSTPFLLTSVLQAAREEGAREKFGLNAFDVGDDHVPFMNIGIPAVDLIDFQFGSAPGLNDYWHTPQDTLDKISAESLEVVGRVTLRVINDLLRR